MNHKAVCKTAPATPGLLNIIQKNKQYGSYNLIVLGVVIVIVVIVIAVVCVIVVVVAITILLYTHNSFTCLI